MSNKQSFNLRLPAGMRDKLHDLAWEQRVSLNELIINQLKEILGENE